jgi:hypothetical protein
MADESKQMPRSAIAPNPAAPFNLAGVTMRTAQAAQVGVVDARTILRFEQTGAIFSARYGGGAISDGYLIGRLEPQGRLFFRYVQADASGSIDQGWSTGFLVRLPDGRLSLTEDFQWITRPGGGRNVFEEII